MKEGIKVLSPLGKLTLSFPQSHTGPVGRSGTELLAQVNANTYPGNKANTFGTDLAGQ